MKTPRPRVPLRSRSAAVPGKQRKNDFFADHRPCADSEQIGAHRHTPGEDRGRSAEFSPPAPSDKAVQGEPMNRGARIRPDQGLADPESGRMPDSRDGICSASTGRMSTTRRIERVHTMRKPALRMEPTARKSRHQPDPPEITGSLGCGKSRSNVGVSEEITGAAALRRGRNSSVLVGGRASIGCCNRRLGGAGAASASAAARLLIVRSGRRPSSRPRAGFRAFSLARRMGHHQTSHTELHQEMAID